MSRLLFPVRAPMQKVTDYLLKCIGLEPSAEVVSIQPARRNTAKATDELQFISK